MPRQNKSESTENCELQSHPFCFRISLFEVSRCNRVFVSVNRASSTRKDQNESNFEPAIVSSADRPDSGRICSQDQAAKPADTKGGEFSSSAHSQKAISYLSHGNHFSGQQLHDRELRRCLLQLLGRLRANDDPPENRMVDLDTTIQRKS